MSSIVSNSLASFLASLFLVSSLMPIIGQLRPWPTDLPEELQDIDIAIHLRVDDHATSLASTDFGGLFRAAPAAILHPSSPADIAALLFFSYSSPKPFAVSARGHGHSVRGQALAPGGVVVDMASLGHHVDANCPNYGRINVSANEVSYVDVGGEQLWIDVLHETLKHGLAPRSWTDYLYLSVGGTLSQAGVSGQAFRYGPQISNVYELDVITGQGEMRTCSHHLSPDLFYAVLGGLGQFGIITRARIALEPAPERVRWVRLIYTDFGLFTRDQEHLISNERGFHYVEGSLLLDHSLISNWRSSFFSATDLGRISALAVQHGGVYCLETTLYYDSVAASSIDQELSLLLEELSFVPGFFFSNDVSYLHFLNRVHDGELKLRSAGLWDVPHPWLNLFIPKSRILDFDQGVFKTILKDKKPTGPILIYPMNKSKWDERMSAIVPDEPIFYSIGLLQSALVQDLHYLEDRNAAILRFCVEAGIGFKQYMPRYESEDDWEKHFGQKWDKFVEMKRKYDPKALLSRAQGIFTSSLLHHVPM